jgi:cell division septal protein FtsQ
MKSCRGTKPAGQRGQSGHDKPTPEALTYPPINIKTKSVESVEKERVFRSIIIFSWPCCVVVVVIVVVFLFLVLINSDYSTVKVPVMYGCTVQ